MSNLVDIPLPQLRSQHQSPERPERTLPQPDPLSKFTGPPAKPGGRVALSESDPRPLSIDAAIWFCVGILVAGALAITPLYLHNIVADAKIEGVERFTDGLQRLNTATARRVWALEAAIQAAAESDAASATEEPLGCALAEPSTSIASSAETCGSTEDRYKPRSVSP